jgi:hypothetical protein
MKLNDVSIKPKSSNNSKTVTIFLENIAISILQKTVRVYKYLVELKHIHAITSIVSKNPYIKRYLSKSRNMRGWFNLSLLPILDLINEYQTGNNISGGIAEIGVYDGKSFIPLFSYLKNNELGLAIDCFGRIQYPLDEISGFESREQIFMYNFKRIFGNNGLKRLKVIIGDSTKMNSKKYLKEVDGAKFRIFSIDGSHSSEATIIDIKNAAESIIRGGIIILDDYFDHDWPGVSEGLSSLFYNKSVNIKPFFIGYNKILLTQKIYTKKYINLISKKFKPYKEDIMFGSKVIIYNEEEIL